ELDRHGPHPIPVVQRPAQPPTVVVVPTPAPTTPRPPPPPGQPTYQNPPQGTPMYPIPGPQLEQLKGSIRREAFSQNRLQVLDAAARSHYFTVAQVQQILPLFDFSNDRLQAVRLLRPRIIDMQNSYQLYASFTFSGDKDELRKILGQ
ncbi:MAG: DUF4476 domain-containing protein, partial [Myxococcaceae bacterium]|nr:DUF4476 domain-containing protein [Myxococcaceae bacterium]